MPLNNTGQKYDEQKLRWSLLPFSSLRQLVKVMTFGAQKYEDNTWQNITNFNDRYFSALMRHISAWWTGEKYDPESNLHHLAHAGCCILFLLWFDRDK